MNYEFTITNYYIKMITFSPKNRNFNIGIFVSQIPYYFSKKRTLNCPKKKL